MHVFLLSLFSHVRLLVTLWTVAQQVPQSMRFCRQIWEWVAMPFSRASSQPRDRTQVSRIVGSFFTIWATRDRTNVLLNSVVKVGLIGRVRSEQTWSRFRSWPNSYKEQEHTRQGGEWDHSSEYGSLLGSFRKLLETSVAAMLRARKRERKKEVRAVIWI